MKYTVYFELFGKKMKTTVEAVGENEARYAVTSKIKWHKIVPEDDTLNQLFDMFGMK